MELLKAIALLCALQDTDHIRHACPKQLYDCMEKKHMARAHPNQMTTSGGITYGTVFSVQVDDQPALMDCWEKNAYGAKG